MCRWFLLGCMILSCGRAALAADELKLFKTIQLDRVNGRIDHMALTPDGQRLFVAALGNNSVEIVNTEQASRAGSIENLSEPQGLFYVAESNQLVVAGGGDGTVRLYDRSLKPTATLKDLDDADNVRYDPKARLLYVGYGSGALAVIDPGKAAKIADIKLDGHPESFQLEPVGNRIFVNVPSTRQIAVVDRDKRTVIAKWPVSAAQSNFPMALDDGNHRLFVGCRNPSKLLVLNTDNGTAIASLDCCGDTDDVFYDAVVRRIYVSGGEGCISVIEQLDADHYKSLDKVQTAPGARTFFFDAKSGTLYLAVPHRGNQQAEIRAFRRGTP